MNDGARVFAGASQRHVGGCTGKEGSYGHDCSKISLGGHVDGINISSSHTDEGQGSREEHMPHCQGNWIWSKRLVSLK